MEKHVAKKKSNGIVVFSRLIPAIITVLGFLGIIFTAYSSLDKRVSMVEKDCMDITEIQNDIKIIKENQVRVLTILDRRPKEQKK